MRARLPIATHLACALAVVLAAGKLAVAHQVFGVGGVLDARLVAEGALLVTGAGWVLWRRSTLGALALFAGSIWLFQESLAPVLSGALASNPAELLRFLGPFELAAWAFLPACFFGWRRLADAGQRNGSTGTD